MLAYAYNIEQRSSGYMPIDSIDKAVYIPRFKVVIYEGDVLFKDDNLLASHAPEVVKRLRRENRTCIVGTWYSNLRQKTLTRVQERRVKKLVQNKRALERLEEQVGEEAIDLIFEISD